MDSEGTITESSSTVKKESSSLPVIDISALVAENPSSESLQAVAQKIQEACRNWGFFYITNHGVSLKLQQQLESVTKEFFELPLEKKMAIQLSLSGRACRGYFPIGNEFTNGRPDLKEGYYFGNEIPETDPRVQKGLPFHGPNVWPEVLPDMKNVILEYLEVMNKLSRSLLRGIALSLGLSPDYFEVTYLQDPYTQFSLFNYPPDLEAATSSEPRWGVGEHTDYGLLTILKQDNSGGLQVKSPYHGWIEAKPIENSFVCNIGDMLQQVSNKFYRSTPHRVKNIYSGKNRVSYPFFFDPSWDAEIVPLPLSHLGVKEPSQEAEKSEEQEKASQKIFKGKYGDYVLGKYLKSFANF